MTDEEKRAYNRAYYVANRERLLADLAAKRSEQRAEYNAYMRAYRETWVPSAETKRKMLAGGDRYRRRNLPKFAAKERARRARKQENGGSYCRKDWNRLVARFGSRCAYCDDLAPLTADHVVPVRLGGTNYIGNILPACSSCNSSKQDRLLVEWRRGG